MGAEEGSPKRVASEAKSPAGRRFFLVTFLPPGGLGGRGTAAPRGGFAVPCAQKKSDSPRGENLPGGRKSAGRMALKNFIS